VQLARGRHLVKGGFSLAELAQVSDPNPVFTA